MQDKIVTVGFWHEGQPYGEVQDILIQVFLIDSVQLRAFPFICVISVPYALGL